MSDEVHVVITGAGGQVGRELQRAQWPEGWRTTALNSAELDISSPDDVRSVIGSLRPRIIVNAAAYTAVDAAESDEQRATAVNAVGVTNLASEANDNGALLVHYSTDYVFDGTKADPYVESDPVRPVGAYGRSKALGEQAATQANHSATLRTAWVYGALGSNFVTTMLRLAAERDEIGVVDDQFGSPTSACDIARATVAIAQRWIRDGALPSSLYHVASPDTASWFDVARHVFESSSDGFDGTLRTLTTEQYPTPAIRPANSRLNTDRLRAELGIQLPPWRESLRSVVQELEATT